MPLKHAGILIEPAKSVPMDKGAQLLATKAASPPEEPPAVRVSSKGFFAVPQTKLSEFAENHAVEQFPLTNTIAPCSFKSWTLTASKSTLFSALEGTLIAVIVPLT